MSSTEGQLCLNITVPSSFTPCRKKKAHHSRQWFKKVKGEPKVKAEKRKISSERSPSKKRRGEQKPPLISPSEGPPSKQRREEEKPPQTTSSSETPPSNQEKPPKVMSSSETPPSNQDKPPKVMSSSETPPSNQEKPPKVMSSSETPPSNQEKPLQKMSSGTPPKKQRKREADKPRDEVTEQQASTPASQKKQRRMTEGHQANGEKRERHGVKGGVKTSSLFKHNPDIPQIDRANVSQLKEKVFTTDSFTDTDLHPHLVATLNKVLNITTMTSVQKQTIPVLLSGRDAVVRSQTGSGKTLAYGIPIVQSLQAVEPKIQRADGPLALVIVPTRELALQSFQTFQKLLKPFTWIVPGVLMGGEKRKAEKARLRKGINILVCTPGRLVDHIKHTLNISFTSIRWLVLDEADRTLDLGFEKDLTVIMNSVNSAADDRTNVLLSATMNQDLSRLVDVCMNNPVRINASDPASSSDDIATAITPVAGQPESFSIPDALQQNVVMVPSKLRLVCLAAFILDKCKGNNKLIVFISSCEAVEFLLSLFTSVLCRPSANQKHPINFLRLHGNMKQEERTEAFQEFSVSKTGVLLCTDVAARGLDLPQVTWIIQYNPPTSVTEYVHRVGRTARIGTRGSCLLFLTPAEAGFITDLANHNISLSETKLLEILSNLMLDDTYKGRGKYHSQTSSSALEQEIRERATVLQTEFENVVHSNPENVQNAKKALQSFLRSYAAYPTPLKHIFHIRGLHLGHAAKSFGLRDAPQGLCAAGQKDTGRKQTKNQDKGKAQRSAKQKANLSEFSSGMTDSKKKRRKKKTGGQVEPEEEVE